MSFTVTGKKLRAVNSGKGWDAIGNMAFQKMKMQMCITASCVVLELGTQKIYTY